MAKTGEKDDQALHKLGGEVMGLGFSTEVRFKVNVGKHIRGKPTEPDLFEDTLFKLAAAEITSRSCLRVVSS